MKGAQVRQARGQQGREELATHARHGADSSSSHSKGDQPCAKPPEAGRGRKDADLPRRLSARVEATPLVHCPVDLRPPAAGGELRPRRGPPSWQRVRSQAFPAREPLRRSSGEGCGIVANRARPPSGVGGRLGRLLPALPAQSCRRASGQPGRFRGDSAKGHLGRWCGCCPTMRGAREGRRSAPASECDPLGQIAGVTRQKTARARAPWRTAHGWGRSTQEQGSGRRARERGWMVRRFVARAPLLPRTTRCGLASQI